MDLNFIDYDEIALVVLRKYSYNKKVIHGQRVANYAIILYDLLRDISGFEKDDKVVLKYASLLHDIGRFINKENHHKHGKYLILKDEDLNGFPQGVRNNMALLVASHRKNLDNSINELSKEKREKLFKLISILRVADAIDLSEICDSVKNIYLDKGSVIVKIERGKYIKKENKIITKSELFEHTYGMNVILQ